MAGRPKGTPNHYLRVDFFQQQRRLLRESLINDLIRLLGNDCYSKMCENDLRFCLGIARKLVAKKKRD